MECTFKSKIKTTNIVGFWYNIYSPTQTCFILQKYCNAMCVKDKV